MEKIPIASFSYVNRAKNKIIEIGPLKFKVREKHEKGPKKMCRMLTDFCVSIQNKKENKNIDDEICKQFDENAVTNVDM